MKHRKPSRTRWVILLGLLAIAGLFTVSAISYWRYVNEIPEFHPRLPPLPEPNGYNRADQALARLLQTKRPPLPPGWPNAAPKQLRAQLAPLRPVLDSVRATYRLPWRVPPGESNLVWPANPDLDTFDDCGRCFVAESRLARSQAEYGMAMQRCLDAMELGCHLTRGGSFVFRQVGLECHSLGLNQAEGLVGLLPASDIAAAQKRVRYLRRAWPGADETLEAERIATRGLFIELLQYIRQMPASERTDGIKSSIAEYGLWQFASILLTPRRASMSSLDTYYRRQIAESRKPVRQRVPVPAPEDPWLEWLPSTKPLDDPWQWERVKTDLALLEVAMAARAHYLEHGRYPERLDEISKRWLPKVPADLWDQPIAYRLKSGKPVIYSLGPDGRDDGGRAVDPVTVGPKTRGDLVFGQLMRRARTARDRNR